MPQKNSAFTLYQVNPQLCYSTNKTPTITFHSDYMKSPSTKHPIPRRIHSLFWAKPNFCEISFNTSHLHGRKAAIEEITSIYMTKWVTM